ncbi:hypothetical protein CH260_24785 [Rhodococcus sp. 05-2256-B2]|uniref:phospholipase D-like domain-containing protein n=1 Tax=unclassified Rhodococcus (in: high G+C Gram-positive bacteria) TaxID=192944 RepID=UPI000B9A9331|nr:MULTISPECIES: phospholipase D-like domain-containing protein [unclassified Rhodococcus (in: high G+C Gram-positive bacteria)]OZD87761.1 hypothetical protein CH258_10145 [Rhodococcus sp. 05-2256-B4]OZD89947.1 hypothetical protein CH260_24785 [Rhodococcus sp. 05-2256-B2]OZD92265.1 hypothetical protein CH257_14335 [Rhodococcus sp. 05-2256-B3]OZD98970.1 hypothetical protein CH285_22790 [Rhodococcus sp. 05-2256-B1]
MTDPSIDQIVRRLGRQPGLRLLSYREIGLPFWELPIKCRMLQRSELPTTTEFILRCIEADVSRAVDISNFLGLPARVIDPVMVDALRTGSITPTFGDSKEVRYRITERGQRVLSEQSEVRRTEPTLHLAYDGLLRRFDLVDRTDRWRPRDLRDNEIVEVRPAPIDPPEIGPDDTAEVRPILKRVSAVSNFDLITVLEIDGKRSRFFKKALALVFESTDSVSELSVQIAVDGRLVAEYTNAFASANGKNRVGIFDGLTSDREYVQKLLGKDVSNQIAPDESVSALKRATESLQQQLDSLSKATSSELDAERAENVRLELDQAEAALASMPVRILEVHEHASFLREGIECAETRLLIVSPWIRSTVVTEEFVDRLRALLTSGVEVIIGYGIDDGKRMTAGDKAAEKALAGLAKAFPNFGFSRLGNTHAKVLLVDSQFVVVTSFNWLSFSGDPARPFRDERGTFVSIPSEIDRIYADYRTQIVGS